LRRESALLYPARPTAATARACAGTACKHRDRSRPHRTCCAGTSAGSARCSAHAAASRRRVRSTR
jgi:hypothetical protein